MIRIIVTNLSFPVTSNYWNFQRKKLEMFFVKKRCWILFVTYFVSRPYNGRLYHTSRERLSYKHNTIFIYVYRREPSRALHMQHVSIFFLREGRIVSSTISCDYSDLDLAARCTVSGRVSDVAFSRLQSNEFCTFQSTIVSLVISHANYTRSSQITFSSRISFLFLRLQQFAMASAYLIYNLRAMISQL